VDEEIARISSLDNLLKTAGQYEIRLIQNIINETINLLKDLSNFKGRPLKTASDFLLRRFNNPAVSSAIICHFRLIASSWLVAKSTTYEAYIPEGLGISMYRNRWLNAPQQEIDALGMTLLADVLLRPLRVGFDVTSMGDNETATQSMYPKISVGLTDNDSSTKIPTIHLLHRHNHYDILYADVHVGEDEEPNGTSDILAQAALQATRAEFDAYSFEESYQVPETRFLRDLTTFAPQEINILPRLENLRLSEGGLDSILDVLNVRALVSSKTFEPGKSPLAGLGEIAAFAEDQEREEAIHIAQRSRLKETEPKPPSNPLSSIKSSASLARDSILPLEYAIEAGQSLSKHDENIPPNTPRTDYETDWEEEEEEETRDGDDVEAFFEHDSIQAWSNLRDPGSMISFLGKVKDGLVECIMKEFWDMTNQTLTSTMRTHGSPADSSSSSSENNGSLLQQLQNFTPGKRPREDGNGEPPNQDGDRGSKKPKSVLTALEISDERPQFACPYRKHDPRKYNVNEWTACALTPRDAVARIKFGVLKTFGADK
jgi:hypothetical protein